MMNIEFLKRLFTACSDESDGYATACEQQGFINGARLALKLFDELTRKEAQ